jgi:alkylation response protein AidB-like acyl-CoA dehydrogenase
MLSRVTSRSVVKNFLRQSKRGVSLLVDNTGLDDESVMIQEMAYKYAQEELEPKAAEWDKTKHFPIDVYKKAADLGFGGIYVSEEAGGSGLNRMQASLIFEALSTGCAGSSAFISIHNMVAWMIDKYGSDDIKSKHLTDLVEMNRLGSYCLTEADSGSDAQAMKSFA